MHTSSSPLRKLLLGAIALAVALSLAACNDGNPTPKTPDSASLAGLGADLSFAGVFGAQTYALGILVNAKDADAPGVLIPQHPTPGDTLLPGVLTCPVVYPGEPQGAAFTIQMEYGEGCESVLDGVQSSGSITFIVNDRPPTGLSATTEFNDFHRGGVAVDGVFTLTGDNQNQTTIQASALNLTTAQGGVLFNANLDAERIADEAGPGPAYCGHWQIVDGTGSVVIANTNFNFTVVDTVLLSTCCAYPLSGSVQITSAGYLGALLDFGDGECDGTATITVAGQTQTVSLGPGQ